MAHIFSPISDPDWPEEVAHLKGDFATQLNVYRTMAHHPALLAAWAPLRQHVVLETALGPDFSEVTILRTGHHLGSDYEWDQHVYRARKLGMSDDRIQSLRGDLADMSSADRVICQAVDQLFLNKALAPDLQSALIAQVGKAGLFDLIATVGFYSTLGYILNSCETPLDDDIAEALATFPRDA